VLGRGERSISIVRDSREFFVDGEVSLHWTLVTGRHGAKNGLRLNRNISVLVESGKLKVG
jgi:hypothetical protein